MPRFLVCPCHPTNRGPYWVEEMLNRTDIRVGPSNGSVTPGVLLALSINVRENSGSICAPLVGAHVDLWHCDAAGLYSDVAANGTVGRKFLRAIRSPMTAATLNSSPYIRVGIAAGLSARVAW